MAFKVFTWVLVVLEVFLALNVLGAITGGPSLDCSTPAWSDRPGWCEDINATQRANSIGGAFVSLLFVNILLVPIWFMLKKKNTNNLDNKSEE